MPRGWLALRKRSCAGLADAARAEIQAELLEVRWQVLRHRTRIGVADVAAAKIQVERRRPNRFSLLLQPLFPSGRHAAPTKHLACPPEGETRIAAGVAIGAVAACVPPWVVASAAPGHSAGDGGGSGGGGAVAAAVTAQLGYLSFQTFDVDSLADHGEELLASSGAEYDVDWGGMDEQQRLRLQHKKSHWHPGAYCRRR